MSTVIWTDRSLDQLADIYVAVPRERRDRVVEVVAEINHQLSENAIFEGESRSGSNRIAFFPPLSVLYSARPHQPVFIVRVAPLRFWKK